MCMYEREREERKMHRNGNNKVECIIQEEEEEKTIRIYTLG
jgi:hypothetical protein